jgi:hypothetical protein
VKLGETVVLGYVDQNRTLERRTRCGRRSRAGRRP